MRIEALREYPGPNGLVRRVGDVYDEFGSTAESLIRRGWAAKSAPQNTSAEPSERKPDAAPTRPAVGPSERKPAGPRERKPDEPNTPKRVPELVRPGGESAAGTRSHKPNAGGSTPPPASTPKPKRKSRKTKAQILVELAKLGIKAPPRTKLKDLARMLRTALGD